MFHPAKQLKELFDFLWDMKKIIALASKPWHQLCTGKYSHVLFLPFSPLLSMGEFKTEGILICQINSLYIHLWLREFKTIDNVCKCRRWKLHGAKIILYSICRRKEYKTNKEIPLFSFKRNKQIHLKWHLCLPITSSFNCNKILIYL